MLGHKGYWHQGGHGLGSGTKGISLAKFKENFANADVLGVHAMFHINQP